ncbi:MAG TPA: AAA family ATPase [Anaerolineales bacterium]
MIRVQVWRARQAPSPTDELQPYYISDQEVDALLDKPLGIPLWALTPLPPDVQQTVQGSLDQKAHEIAELKAGSREQGIPLRLEMIANLFGLEQFDQDALLVCLAPEIDLRYERLYAYLQDEFSRRSPSVDLALNLLCPTLEEKIRCQERFTASAPLRRWSLLHFMPSAALPEPPLLARSLKLDDRIRRFLLGNDEPDEALLSLVEFLEDSVEAGLALADEESRRLAALAAVADDQIFYFQGPPGAGKRGTAAALAQQRGQKMLVLSGRRLAESRPEDFADLAWRADREARLQSAVLYWQDFDAHLVEGREYQWDAARKLLVARPGLTLLGGEAAWDPGRAFVPIPFARLSFELPGAAERLALWERSLAGEAAVDDLQRVAAHFRLSRDQIRGASAAARNLARWRDPGGPQITAADLLGASRLHSNQKLAALAQKILPHYAWQDIVLPAEQMRQLHELCDRVRYRSVVLEEWGFDRKLALGKGLNALFSGPPGTGKTMAADILAGALNLDLYKIDLSMVVSKYIGETEKNLARIFAEAATSNAILFFDEADALFGKRTEVKDAHDRYANLEISYLLQKMEEYDGLVILATNLRQNIDRAFLRRMHYLIEFPLPDAHHRLQIWKGIWPDAAPRSADLDMNALAEQLDVAGANIRNIALAAAYLAAAEGRSISMAHLKRAAESEYKKIGKFTNSSG